MDTFYNKRGDIKITVTSHNCIHSRVTLSVKKTGEIMYETIIPTPYPRRAASMALKEFKEKNIKFTPTELTPRIQSW